MKQIYLLLMILLVLIGCSSEESSRQQVLHPISFEMSSDEMLLSVSIRINDDEGHTIQSYDFEDRTDIQITINSGEEIIIYVVDEDNFNYSYQMLNSDSTVQFSGVQNGNVNHTLIKQYIIQ